MVIFSEAEIERTVYKVAHHCAALCRETIAGLDKNTVGLEN
jgi:hypothetical protein